MERKEYPPPLLLHSASDKGMIFCHSAHAGIKIPRLQFKSWLHT